MTTFRTDYIETQTVVPVLCDGKPWLVVMTQASGRERIWGRYDSKRNAQQAARGFASRQPVRVMRTPLIVDLWCNDCEELWETKAFVIEDCAACPQCRSYNVNLGRSEEALRASLATRAERA